MDCSCGKSWNPSDASFPTCWAPVCPLRSFRDKHTEEQLQKPMFVTQYSNAIVQKGATQAATVSQSIDKIREDFMDDIVEYDMKGALSAKTTVKLPDGSTKIFRTTNQIHSEMVAIEWMLNAKLWVLNLGQIYWFDGSDVPLKFFTTSEPHCGFCTLFLAALGLPLSKPTCGNHQLASRLSYQLPVELEVDEYFVARVLAGGTDCSFGALKQVLNLFVNLPPDQWALGIVNQVIVEGNQILAPNIQRHVIHWNDLINDPKRQVVYAVWKFIFNALLQSNKGK